MDKRRVRIIKDVAEKRRPVVYWMSRDQRAADNWSLVFAQELAKEHGVKTHVAFNLVDSFLEAGSMHFRFMIDGLHDVSHTLAKNNIPFHIVCGKPEKQVPLLLDELGAGSLVVDFDPLRIKKQWLEGVLKGVEIPVYQVDAHNIVPAWFVSEKREYGAYTIRPKINRLLDGFLVDFPRLRKQQAADESTGLSLDGLEKKFKNPKSGDGFDCVKPGYKAGFSNLKTFLETSAHLYQSRSNDPLRDVQSGISAYLHFGQISPQRVALEVLRYSVSNHVDVSPFLEQLIVRRELADNFLHYTDDYDKSSCFPDWAKKTLADHIGDRREYIYSLKDLECSRTHDQLWNSAQNQMLRTGKMHGYMRMYWAKKVVEWTEDPATAMKYLIVLNDRYSLDGRDPNGYAGIAWAVGGVHDRAFRERPIFGKVRYMSEAGCRRKFNVDQYVQIWG